MVVHYSAGGTQELTPKSTKKSAVLNSLRLVSVRRMPSFEAHSPVDGLDQASAQINIDQSTDVILLAANTAGLPSPADLLIFAAVEVVEGGEYG